MSPQKLVEAQLLPSGKGIWILLFTITLKGHYCGVIFGELSNFSTNFEIMVGPGMSKTGFPPDANFVYRNSANT